MLFTSSIFLYLFFPVVLAAYLLLGRFSKTSWPIIHLLILASFVFYGYQNPYNIALLSFSIIVNFFIAQTIELKQVYSKLAFVLGVVFNLGLLFYFKYTNFMLDNISFLTDQSFTHFNIVLPLAISFYTFQQIAFLVDTYTCKTDSIHFRDYVLFVTFFPQLIIGPIVHHSEMMPQFKRPSFGKVNWNNFITGAFFLFSGIAKKLFIADPMGTYVDKIYNAAGAGEPILFTAAWISTLAFTIQIYFDFSGYTDMAIGLAKIFGIDLPINFNSPYKAPSVAEFWHRWHMTLSRWLRDYLYIPLGGNERGLRRNIINVFIVFFLGGLWHGAAWTFIIWGLLHSVGVSLSHAFKHFRITPPKILGIAVTFVFVAVLWVLFRAQTITIALSIYSALFSLPTQWAMPEDNAPFVIMAMALLIIFCLPNTHTAVPVTKILFTKLPKAAQFCIILVVWLSLAAFNLDSSAEFIYFDF